MTTTAAVRVYDFIVLFYKFGQLLFCALCHPTSGNTVSE